jgi:hypothetical protein
MKAITVKQPWAYLICAGIKDVENRSWRSKYRGRILIHAGSKIIQPQFAIFGQADIREIEFAKAVGIVEEKGLTSAVIGSVEIVDCAQNHPSIWAEKGVWHWVLKNPILFKNPILNVKGKLSFWESGYEVCHICGQPANLICARCGEWFCSDCQTPYNEFTQIDYDCCKPCGNREE